jgi:hypothetical protein
MSEEVAAVATGEGGEVAAEAEATPEDILGAVGLLEQATAETVEVEKAEAEEKPKDEKPAGEKKKTRREFEAFLMSEAELAKPDGLKKAADYWQRRQSKLDAMDIKVSKKFEGLTAERAAAESWFAGEQQKLEADRATARSLVALSKRLQDPENLSDVLDAIGEITGRRGAGREIWEKLAQFAIKGGRRTEESTELRRVREELAELKATISKVPEEQQQRAKAAEDAQLQAKIAEREKLVIATAQDAAKYPELARQLTAMPSLGKNLIRDVINIRRKARESGSPVDIPTALGRIETALAKRAPAPTRRDSARPVAATVTSIAPSQARSSTVVRDKTQEERERDLAADSGYLASLGLA